MAVPRKDKNITHQVIKVTYDTIGTKYLLITNIVLTLLLLLTILYTVNVVHNQEDRIIQLTKFINQLSYDENIGGYGTVKPDRVRMKNSLSLSNSTTLGTQDNDDIDKQQMSEIGMQLTELKGQIVQLNKKMIQVRQILEHQSMFTQKMKQLIEVIKQHLSYFTSLVQKMIIPRPELSQMKDSILNGFNSLKSKMGFPSVGQPDGQQAEKEAELYTHEKYSGQTSSWLRWKDNIKNKLKNGWKSKRNELF